MGFDRMIIRSIVLNLSATSQQAVTVNAFFCIKKQKKTRDFQKN